MKTLDITVLCLVAAMVALTMQARPLSVGGTDATGSTNATPVKTIVTNTAACERAAHASEALATPVPKVPLQNVGHNERAATVVRPASLSTVSNRTENRRATNAPAVAAQTTKNYAISARVLMSGQAARTRSKQKGNPGFADLVGAETNAIEFLGYRDYCLIKGDRGLVGQNDAYTLAFDTTGSVAVKPLYENRRKIHTEITWRMPGQADLTTKIFIHRDRPVVIGGPKIKGGGIYLLSLTIK